MIITISGLPGSGKSTVASLLAQKLNLTHISAGDFMREMAKERGVSLIELSRQAERDPSIDREIDERTVRFGREQDDFVMDGRLAWQFIPQSISIYLVVDPDVAAKRIYLAKRPDERNNTLHETQARMQERFRLEVQRYEKYYGVDYTDPEHYDFVIDTNNISVEEVVERIVAFLRQTGKL